MYQKVNPCVKNIKDRKIIIVVSICIHAAHNSRLVKEDFSGFPSTIFNLSIYILQNNIMYVQICFKIFSVAYILFLNRILRTIFYGKW